MSKPTFQEIMEFNATTWPLFREYFTTGLFSKQEADEFLRKHCLPKVGDYVLFKEIPKKLHVIITPGHAYRVVETSYEKSYMFLDNYYGDWVNNHYLEICPLAEIKKRRRYW